MSETDPESTRRPAHAVPPGAEGAARGWAESVLQAAKTQESVEPGAPGLPKAQVPVLMLPVTPPKSEVVPMASAVLPAAGAAGLVAAVVVPLDRPGIGWVLTAAVLAGAIFAVDRRARPRDAPRHFTRASAGWAALSLALLAVGAVRASGWLFILCGLAAVVTGSLAVVGRRTMNTTFYDVLAVPIEAFGSIPWVARGLRGSGRQRGRVFGAVLAAVAVVVVFLPLLTSADAAFAHFVGEIVPDLGAGTIFRWGFLFCVALFGVTGACYLLASPPFPAADGPRTAQGDRLLWTLPLATLVVLFAGFVGVRIAVLFGGKDYVLRTGGLTSAEYARGGFWQLCACTVLTLGIISAALRWGPRELKGDRIGQRILLGALAALSLVLVLSALSRMWTYQEAYGFTVLRLLVEVCEIWLGCVFLLVGVSLVRLRSAWLPRAAIATAAAALLALAVADPEALIAGANIDRAAQGKPLDTRYLGGFSTDIVPVVAQRLPDAGCVLRPVLRDLPDDSWPGWNLSRASARAVRLSAVDCG
ncbi:DUF4153 domain-containing protein [Amycolatopsis sp. NBC_01480]|uniref:DUF4153 domain-containing protein n=1 Tax=Amycolatopsis sp. NBC_01480 TaxID=2903562 RepID=UPI002E2B629E|nr:DUF4173 domain-containing protein [Amycolatopsis sp. NBC_01480]